MNFDPGKRKSIQCFLALLFYYFKFLITGKLYRNLKSAKEFLDQITKNHDAAPAEQSDVLLSDVPTKLDVTTVTNTVISG